MSINTKKLYQFECEIFKDHKSLPMKKLRQIALDLWKKEGKKRVFPRIVAGKGTRYNGRYLSYYEKLKTGPLIMLARNQRDEITLCHELTHALGYGDHDSKFVKKYLELLSHLGYTVRSLEAVAKEYKLAGYKR